ncbi:Uncharacterised protein [uncultured archaeon]|nr:Uncharacterised protein [uncultured archaeon]
MEKKHFEIGISAGLVAMMIALMLIVQITAPQGVRSAGFAIVMLLFMIVMGLAGVRLLDM